MAPTETFLAYSMSPRGPFRFGERGIGLEETAVFPHSETLFSAIVSAWRLMDGPDDVAASLATFPTGDQSDLNPPMQISSAFPYAGSIRFLPRPLIRLGTEETWAKEEKEIAYLSWARMEDLLGSRVPDDPRKEHLRQAGILWIHPKDVSALDGLDGDRVWINGEDGIVPRVTLDRGTSASALYFQGQAWFTRGCGFYILARFHGDRAKEYQDALERALEMLGAEGLGGRRSVGLGRFDLDGPTQVSLSVPDKVDAALLLSLYHPTREEITGGILDSARYRLITRRGWITSPDDSGQRRKSVRMLCEGSILPRSPMGDLAMVAPDNFPHPVYRSGLALTIPCRRWTHA